MAEPTYDISGLNNKVNDGGQTATGRLSASEFNLLVNASIESQDKISGIEDYYIPISVEEYEALKEAGLLGDRPYYVYEN